ncbi:hypothetical protein OK016_09480 [Vibrio chagasii]|nr:hypothetical protein [Vibrio chagasii]
MGEREASQSDVANRVGGLVKDVQEMAVTAFQMPELPGAGSGLPIQFVITTQTVLRACSKSLLTF